MADEDTKAVLLVRTVGAPAADDPRDGELHQFFGSLPGQFDLEPWDGMADGIDAHYVRDDSPPVEEGDRLIWQFKYAPG